MIIVLVLLIAAIGCLVLALPSTPKDTKVIGKMTQQGWKQYSGPLAVKYRKRN